jgi:hypothetical protein
LTIDSRPHEVLQSCFNVERLLSTLFLHIAAKTTTLFLSISSP